jgi:hypothetical protein
MRLPYNSECGAEGPAYRAVVTHARFALVGHALRLLIQKHGNRCGCPTIQNTSTYVMVRLAVVGHALRLPHVCWNAADTAASTGNRLPLGLCLATDAVALQFGQASDARITMKPPFAIRILIWLAALASAGMYLSILLVYSGIGPTLMGGEHVTRAEWLHIAAPLVAVIGILMALISYGFAARKPWSRHLVIAMFSLIVVYGIITGALGLIRPIIMWRAIVNATVSGCVSIWYFYFKPNVAGYFRSLANRREL